MSKMSTDFIRHALNGPVMGTRWTAVIHAAADHDMAPLHADLAAAVAQVDQQMSTWKPDSDLSRLNAAPVNVWLPQPPELLDVIAIGLAVGIASDGAFDIGLGDLVAAWGFGAGTADAGAVRALINQSRPRADQIVQIDRANGTLRKLAPIQLDLNGIAKGYAVDQMTRVILAHGITSALAGLDGELRAMGPRPDGKPWTLAVERPDHSQRAPVSVLALDDAAVATSGDYRHWIDVGSCRLSHTMDRTRAAPLRDGPASVTVVAPTCVMADAWATALMVLGSRRGAVLARRIGLNALFLERDGSDLRQTAVGGLFEPAPPI